MTITVVMAILQERLRPLWWRCTSGQTPVYVILSHL